MSTNCIIYEANIDCGIAGHKQKCYLSSCETKFEDRFGHHKKAFNHVKRTNDTELSKEFWEMKSAMEYKKLHGKLTEYVVLTIQTVSAAFYVYMRNTKLQHTNETIF